MTVDERTAECRVFTYKEGLLSAMAHDLELLVGRFTVEIAEDGAIDARFDPRSLRVVAAIAGGRPDPGVLSERDRRTIERHIADDVLEARRHPEIRFTARPIRDAAGLRLDGRLALHGRERAVSVTVAEEGERLVASARLHQPDFGIRPFTAMLGTLRIQPDVTVRLSVPRRLVGDMVPA